MISLLYSCRSGKEKADLIVRNAKVYKVDNNFSTAESFAIKDGKFIAIGTNSEIEKKYEADSVIDAQGKTIVPGLIDAHCHFFSYAMNLQNADLTGTNSVEEIIKTLKEHHKKFPDLWIVGRGWDQNKWKNKNFPAKQVLDSVFPDVPVVLTRVDGHAVWVNSETMKRLKINKNSKFPEGEAIYENKELTGIFRENTAGMIKSSVPPPSKKQMIKLLVQAQNNCFAVGLTSVSDAGVSKMEIDLIDSLQKAKTFSLGYYAMLQPTEENMKTYVEKGIYKTDKLNVRSIKLYVDGALGSRGALLKKPYSDEQTARGILVTKIEELKKYCNLANKYGYQVNTHAIGDSGVSVMLNVYGEILKGTNDKRWRIEHSQIVDDVDLPLFKKYSVVPSVQATHATSDMYWAKDRLGNERVKFAYRFKDLMLQNGWIPNGTDAPVEKINPMFTFYAAVARKDQKGFPEGGFQKENAITREDALKSMTIWAAKSFFEENENGSIEAGKVANFVILDNDLMTSDENKLFEIKPLKTFVDGKEVFSIKK